MTTRRSNGDHRKRAPTGGVQTARPQKDFYDRGRVRAPNGSRFPRGYGRATGRDFRQTTDQTTDQRGVSCRVSPLIVGRRGLEPRTYGLKVRSSTIELALFLIDLAPFYCAPRASGSHSHPHSHPFLVIPIARSVPVVV